MIFAFGVGHVRVNAQQAFSAIIGCQALVRYLRGLIRHVVSEKNPLSTFLESGEFS